MNKKKILLGLLIAAGAAYVVCKALTPRVEVKAADENAENAVTEPEQKDVEKQPVDIEEVVAYVTQPVEADAAAEVSADVQVEEAAVSATDAVITEEDFVEDETV